MSSQPPAQNPFKGLRPYEQKDELFGRDRDLVLMKDRIFSARTTLLFAGSGVGKTSFLNAKVIPELKKNCCVIWHNRWTGTDEKSDADTGDDRPRFKIWPPRALRSWLIAVSNRGIWRDRKVLKSSVTSPPQLSAPPDEDKISAEVRRVISQNLRGEGGAEKLSGVLSVFKKETGSEPSNKQRCVLILDQFEEVFQYHSFQEYFETFVSSLCEIINSNNYQVRVVFSMREEFLGELSVFDNRIPDLFNNYYRLRYPEIEEAKDIIWQTCKSANIDVHQENLDSLVGDLSKIETGLDEPRHEDGTETQPARFLRRNFVPPPYLQIVCDRLWKEQYESPAPDAATNGHSSNTKSARFLEIYHKGSDGSVNGGESDAQRAVRTFCEEKLSPPFLRNWEQNLVARAFNFLVTRQGAKMAYELNNLACHMEEPVWPLKLTLQKLSSPDARILRVSRGPERSYWFELYHDMYAGVVERWKRRYEKERRRRTRIRFAAYSGVLAVSILLIAGFAHFIQSKPWKSQEILKNFKDSLATTDIQSDSNYSKAIQAYSNLLQTWGYSREAHSLWAEVWQRRAQLYEAKEQREEALLSLLQAAAFVKGYPAEKNYLAQANNLFATNEEAIKFTYCTGCQTARVSPDGNYVLTIGKGNVEIWSGAQRSTACSDCRQAQFSADSRFVASVANITEEPPKISGEANKRRGEGRVQASAQAAANSSPSPAPDASPSSTPTPTRRITGWQVKFSPVSPSESSSSVSFAIRGRQPALNEDRSEDTAEGASRFSFRLKAVNMSPMGPLVAGVLINELIIWRYNQTEFGQVVPIKSGALTLDPTGAAQLFASFSPDGKYFVAGGPVRLPTQFWEVTPQGLFLSTKINELSRGRNFGFSADGKYFLSATKEEDVKLWDLAAQNEVLKIDVPEKQLSRIAFGTGSGKFFVSQRNGSITVWDSDTRKSVFQPLVPGGRGAAMLLDSEGKTIVRRRILGGRTSSLFDKWSFETGKQVGELELDGAVIGSYLTSDASLLISSGSAVRIWDIPLPKPYQTFSETPDESSSFGDLSNDGNTLLTVEDHAPSMLRLWNVATTTRIWSQPINHDNYSMSSDALRIAVVPETGNGVDVFDRTRSDSPRKLVPEHEVTTTSFSPDNKILAVATTAKEVHLIDAISYVTTKVFKSEVDIHSLSFGPGNKFLLIKEQEPFDDDWEFFDEPTPATPPLEVWSMTTGEKVPLNIDLKESVQASDLSNDERLLTLQNKRILIWNLADGAQVSEFAYDKKLSFAKFTPDGKSIITCDSEGKLETREVAGSGRYGSPVTLGNPVEEIVFSSDGSSFVAVTESWMHRIAIVEQGLRYSEGIFAARLEPSSVRLFQSIDSDSTVHSWSVRWISDRVSKLQAHTASFDGKLSKPVLNGDVTNLIMDWKAKLNFNVDPLGYLSKDMPNRPSSERVVAAPTPVLNPGTDQP